MERSDQSGQHRIGSGDQSRQIRSSVQVRKGVEHEGLRREPQQIAARVAAAPPYF
jgi:hypothetical protein